MTYISYEFSYKTRAVLKPYLEIPSIVKQKDERDLEVTSKKYRLHRHYSLTSQQESRLQHQHHSKGYTERGPGMKWV